MTRERIEEAPDPSPSHGTWKLVASNLALLVVVGVGLSSWLLFYTDYFPVVGGLLGLGGLFAWLAFLAGLLRVDTKEKLQQRFEDVILANPKTRWGTLATGLALLLVGSGFGSIEIKSLESRGCAVKILRGRPEGRPESASSGPRDLAAEFGNPSEGGRYLEPSSKQRTLLWTWWWPGRDYWVKASGLPARRIRLTGLRRTTLVIPGSFEGRPVVLIRPTSRMSLDLERDQRADASRFDLVVWLDEREIGRVEGKRYAGQTVWVGCDANVSIPRSVIERLRLELRSGEASAGPSAEDVLALWRVPLAVGETFELQAGKKVMAALCPKRGGENGTVSPWGFGEWTIAAVRPGEGFVQVLRLRNVGGTETKMKCKGG